MRCGDSCLPKDDTNHRIPRRISIGCQTEPQSSEFIRSPNGVQDQDRIVLSSALAVPLSVDLSQWDHGELFNHSFPSDDRWLGNYLAEMESDANFVLAEDLLDFGSNVKSQYQHLSHIAARLNCW